MKYLNPDETDPVVIADSKFLVRTSGPEELRWSGVGPASIGVVNLPANEAIRIDTIVFRSPSGDGQNKVAGSKAPNAKMGQKTPDEIFNDIRREYPNFSWYLFTTRDEATSFCETGKTDWQTLGVEPGSSLAVVKQAYYNLSRTHHPDKGGDTETFQNIVGAFKRIENGK